MRSGHRDRKEDNQVSITFCNNHGISPKIVLVFERALARDYDHKAHHASQIREYQDAVRRWAHCRQQPGTPGYLSSLYVLVDRVAYH